MATLTFIYTCVQHWPALSAAYAFVAGDAALTGGEWGGLTTASITRDIHAILDSIIRDTDEW